MVATTRDVEEVATKAEEPPTSWYVNNGGTKGEGKCDVIGEDEGGRMYVGDREGMGS